jgi:chemotaxis protein methyltransferase CheR
MRTVAAIDETNLLRFAELIERRLGLHFDGSSLKELTVILRARMRALHCSSFDVYLRRLEAARSMHEELRELAAEITLGETYFFRSPEQFAVFSELALPRLTLTQPARQILILSAGCATGEEPYSLAMTLRGLGPSAPARVSILGLDVNPESITKARRGRYSAWAMRAMPPAWLKKYFRRDWNQYVLDEGVRAMVRFEERNLALEDRNFWQPRSFDLIFCRNVTMYLSARALGEVVARFARVLAPDGFLFLSQTEPLRGISQAFHVEHAHGAFYYVLRAASDKLAGAPRAPDQSRDSLATSILSASPPSFRLTPAISARFPPEAPSAAKPSAHPLDLRRLTEQRPSLSLGAALMNAERFDEALATLEALPPADRGDPDVLLLTAIILTERGQLDQAAQLCASLLALDDLNAAAHYLTALCHEQAGRRAAAVDSYRVDVYLDRAFAMPHLRLGLMFRREGDLPSARRELQNASMLLTQEDPARVLLFGGGFSRSTLIDLCASELRLCEEAN